MIGLDAFSAIWVIDFEFTAPLRVIANADLPGRTRSAIGRDAGAVWSDALTDPPPFGGPHDLVVAFFATAEMGCYLALGWPRPVHLLDLYAEFRILTNDGEPHGSSLLHACAAFGVSTIAAAEKDAGRTLAIRGGPYTNEERAQLLNYCASDVTTTTELFHRMQPRLDLGRALLRGRSMAAFACVEHVGYAGGCATVVSAAGVLGERPGPADRRDGSRLSRVRRALVPVPSGLNGISYSTTSRGRATSQESWTCETRRSRIRRRCTRSCMTCGNSARHCRHSD